MADNNFRDFVIDKRYAQMLTGILEEHRRLALVELQEVILQVSSAWEGQSRDLYVERLLEMQEEMVKLSESIQSASLMLENVCRTEENTDEK